MTFYKKLLNSYNAAEKTRTCTDDSLYLSSFLLHITGDIALGSRSQIAFFIANEIFIWHLNMDYTSTSVAVTTLLLTFGLLCIGNVDTAADYQADSLRLRGEMHRRDAVLHVHPIVPATVIGQCTCECCPPPEPEGQLFVLCKSLCYFIHKHFIFNENFVCISSKAYFDVNGASKGDVMNQIYFEFIK